MKLIDHLTEADAEIDKNTKQFAKLVCLILSGNTKDKSCIRLTALLHSKGYLDINKMANTKPTEIKNLIWKAGYQRKRAEFLVNMAIKIRDEYGGIVPGTLLDLTSFDRVAQKTAILLLNEAFGLFEGIGCDVHVSQCCEGMKLVDHQGKRLSPIHAEMALREWVPEKKFREVNKIFGSFAQLFTQYLPLRANQLDERTHQLLVDISKAGSDFIHKPYHVELLFCLIRITRQHYRSHRSDKSPSNGKKHRGKPAGDSDPEDWTETEDILGW